MANQYINALTDLWNNAGTTYQGISLNVTNTNSAADSKLFRLRVGAVDQFSVSKAGVVTATGAITSGGGVLVSANDGGALGASGTAFSDLFLASGAVINLNNGDVTITHSANALAFAGAASGYTFDTKLTVGHTANLTIGGNADNMELFGTNAATGGLALGMFSATPAVSAHLDFYKSANAAIGSATVVASGEAIGAINFFGAQQTGTFATQNPAAQIRAEVDGVVTSGAGADMPGRIVFSTTADAAGTVTDRLILDAAGILKPNANDGVALGTAALSFSDLFLASGAVINLNNGNWVATHSSGILTLGTGDLRITTAGTNAASAVTVGGTQTLTNKTLTDPLIIGTIKEDIFVITDAAGYVINPDDGSIQRWTLTASRTPGAAHANWTDGKSVTLLIADGTAFAITWSTLGVVWKGGIAPTLASTGFTEVNITKENGVLRGVNIGDFTS